MGSRCTCGASTSNSGSGSSKPAGNCSGRRSLRARADGERLLVLRRRREQGQLVVGAGRGQRRHQSGELRPGSLVVQVDLHLPVGQGGDLDADRVELGDRVLTKRLDRDRLRVRSGLQLVGDLLQLAGGVAGVEAEVGSALAGISPISSASLLAASALPRAAVAASTNDFRDPSIDSRAFAAPASTPYRPAEVFPASVAVLVADRQSAGALQPARAGAGPVDRMDV